MGNEKWGNYTQEFTLGHDAEEIKNVQAILNRPRSCTDFSPAARYAVSKLCDSVPVVRCRECKHCDPENYHCDHPMGTAAPLKRKPDDFCSYGERKDGEAE